MKIYITEVAAGNDVTQEMLDAAAQAAIEQAIRGKTPEPRAAASLTTERVTRIEGKILSLLEGSTEENAVPRDLIKSKVWGDITFGDIDQNLRVRISRIRKKYGINIRYNKVGYYIAPPEREAA